MDPISRNVIEGIHFLAELYDDGLSYSSINTARSALSTLMQLQDGENFGSNSLVSRFMKGVFAQRPALPRYKEIWDVSVVLRYIEKWHPLKELDLKCLTLKTVMLMTLISGQRCQTINALNISNMHLTENRCIFEIKELLKTTRPNSHFGVVEFAAYAEEPLCVLACLREYIARTKTLRGGNTKLLISFCKPHNAVTTSTVSRWLKETLRLSGIDITVYKSHSVRAAATSAANSLNLPIEDILSAAGWSGAETFRKFYNKPLVKSESFANRLLAIH